jgi:hypothetical protein
MAVDSDIRDRLALIEGDFLTALAMDSTSLATSMTLHTKLAEDIDGAATSTTLADSTLQMVRTIANSVEIITQSVLNMQSASEEVSTSLHQQLVETMITSSLSPHIASSTGTRRSLPTGAVRSSVSRLFFPWQSWLMNNLHNPYPSPETKQLLAHQTGKSVESVNRWFINARSRIGWTDISKNHFLGSRNDTVDGAYRAYVEDDLKNPLPSKVIFAFMKMKADAEALYSEKIKPSRLAMQIDAVVKDVTSEERNRLNETKVRGIEDDMTRKAQKKGQMITERANEDGCRKAVNMSACTSYPSPAHSLTGSPEPSSNELGADGDEDPSPPAPVAGCKRKLSTSSEPAEAACRAVGTFKRARWDFH